MKIDATRAYIVFEKMNTWGIRNFLLKKTYALYNSNVYGQIIFVLALINVLVIQIFYNNLNGGENRQLLGSISFLRNLNKVRIYQLCRFW